MSNDLRWSLNVAFSAAAERFEKCLKMHPLEGHDLVEACRKAGFQQGPDPVNRLSYWLFDHMGRQLTIAAATPEWKHKVGTPGYQLTDEDRLIVQILAEGL